MSKRKRKPKRPDPNITVGDTIETTVVPDSVLRYWGNLGGVIRAMNKRYGEGKWGDTELRHYVAQRAIERQRAWDKWQAGHKDGRADRAVVAPSGEIEDRTSRIMSQYPHLDKTNLPQVRQLAVLERALDAATERFQNAVDSEKQDPKDIRQYQQTMTSLSAEIRQLYHALRIDVGSLQGEGPEELRKEVVAIMDQAQTMLQKHAIRLVCPACLKQSVHINLGFLLFHFRQNVPWHLYLVCPHPKCGQGIHITGGPGQETRIYNGPEQMKPPLT